MINLRCDLQKAGCDNKLGSELVVDRCGICGGDNSTCRMERVYNRFNLVNLTYGELPSLLPPKFYLFQYNNILLYFSC